MKSEGGFLPRTSITGVAMLKFKLKLIVVALFAATAYAAALGQLPRALLFCGTAG